MLKSLWEVKVLRFLLVTSRKHSGSEIIKELNIKSGTLYPLLHNLEKKKLIIGEDEVGDSKKIGRPLFRFYSLTDSGRIEIEKILHELSI